MKRTRGCRTIADACGADCVRDALEPVGHKGSVHDRNHRTEMADHRKDSFRRTATMHIAIAGAHRAEGRTEESADSIDWLLAEGQSSGGISYQGREQVAFSQRQPNRHA